MRYGICVHGAHGADGTVPYGTVQKKTSATFPEADAWDERDDFDRQWGAYKDYETGTYRYTEHKLRRVMW